MVLSCFVFAMHCIVLGCIAYYCLNRIVSYCVVLDLSWIGVYCSVLYCVVVYWIGFSVLYRRVEYCVVLSCMFGLRCIESCCSVLCCIVSCRIVDSVVLC